MPQTNHYTMLEKPRPLPSFYADSHRNTYANYARISLLGSHQLDMCKQVSKRLNLLAVRIYYLHQAGSVRKVHHLRPKLTAPHTTFKIAITCQGWRLRAPQIARNRPSTRFCCFPNTCSSSPHLSAIPPWLDGGHGSHCCKHRGQGNTCASLSTCS